MAALIQRMAANSRYFTDSASKIPHDVGQGNAAAGMCIDFYGRSYADELKSPSGTPRVVWIAPAGRHHPERGSDRRAQRRANMEVAQEFVEFCLSPKPRVCGSANRDVRTARKNARCTARRSGATFTRRKTSRIRPCRMLIPITIPETSPISAN
jgi:ABC-type Fe3+ transport system substrate-binding protein